MILDFFRLLQTEPKDLVAFDSISFDFVIKHFQSDFKFRNVAVDGAIMPDYPEKLAESMPKYPTLVGYMDDEYAWMNKNIIIYFQKNSILVPVVFEEDLSNITSTDVHRPRLLFDDDKGCAMVMCISYIFFKECIHLSQFLYYLLV